MNGTRTLRPVVLISMDGVGVDAPGPGNAVTAANTPNLDSYWPNYPHTYLEASGINVGLPTGTDGNSEVGHTILGAGKIIFQDLPRIDNAISNESFFENPELKEAFAFAMQNGGKVHVFGLIGSGKVHASVDHLYAIVKFAAQEKIPADKFLVHAITDGRDSPPDKAAEYLGRLEGEMTRLKTGRIASLIGRYYAMDRDRRWDRTELAYKMMVEGVGSYYPNYEKAIKDSYAKDKTDEFIEPAVIARDQASAAKVENGDAVVFFNYRPDRAIQLAMAFADKEFTGFKRELLDNIHFVSMTEYEPGMPPKNAFPPEEVENYLGKVLSDHKLKQLRIAESEKFAHVTYFFNAGNQEVNPGETWIEVPSPKEVATYDQKPEMSQEWMTNVLLEKMGTGEYDFVMCNFAGPDMVAHTGVIDAAIKAIEVCDQNVGRIVQKALEMGGAVIITADHGNAEEMLNLQTGEPDTKHSINPVPVIIIAPDEVPREIPVGNLADVAPTILSLMNIEKPAEMTGRNLLA